MRAPHLSLLVVLVVLALSVGASMILPGRAAPPLATGSLQCVSITRVSVSSTGEQGNDDSNGAAISVDGRFVAMESDASNLAPNDTNGVSDIFVHDRQTGQTTRVSVASDGTQADHYSNDPVISADGRYVAFSSRANNLHPPGWEGTAIYVHDRQIGQTTLVSRSTCGRLANRDAFYPTISADGRYVAFETTATNLFHDDDCDGYCDPGNQYCDNNNLADIYMHDRQTGETTLVSFSPSNTYPWGGWNPRISADGRYVAHEGQITYYDNYRDVVLRDRVAGQTELISLALDGASAGNYGAQLASPAVISADGRYVVFESESTNLVPNDTNECGTPLPGICQDVFVSDRQTGQTSRVSVASDGSQANWQSRGGSISADGRYVVFDSDATNLVPNDPNGGADVFLHDRQTGETTRLSVASYGYQEGGGMDGVISADGRFVAFSSPANDLVPNDTNGDDDIFVCELGIGEPPTATPTATPTNTPTPTPTPTIPPTPTPSDVIHGQVTYVGAGIGGINLTLWRGSAGGSSLVQTTTTQANGGYQFTGVPPLLPGEWYRMQYRNGQDGNPSNANHLRNYQGPKITSLSGSGSTPGGDMELVDIDLEEPPNNAKVNLSANFNWNSRPSSPTDSYQFVLSGIANPNFQWTSGALGYVNSYGLSALPKGVWSGIPYNWGIKVTAQDGGSGVSNEQRTVTVNAPASQKETGGTGANRDYGKSYTLGDPVSSANGAYHFDLPLLALGGPFDLGFTLRYRSDYARKIGRAHV